MDVRNPNFVLGLSFFMMGVAFLVVFETWYVGVPFMLMGAHRLYVAYVATTNDATVEDQAP